MQELVVDVDEEHKSSVSIDVDSSDPMGQLRSMLNALDVEDEQVVSMSIDIEFVEDVPTVDEVEPDEVEVGPTEGKEFEGGANGKVPPDRVYEGKKRGEDAVMPYTETAGILEYLLDKTEEGEWATTVDMREEIDDERVNNDNINSQISSIYHDRGLIKRRSTGNDLRNKPQYEYQIDQDGREALRQGQLIEDE